MMQIKRFQDNTLAIDFSAHSRLVHNKTITPTCNGAYYRGNFLLPYYIPLFWSGIEVLLTLEELKGFQEIPGYSSPAAD